MADKKSQVVDLIKAIETGASEPIGSINPEQYTQHDLASADGLAGFAELLQQLPPNSARAETVRVFQDGDYVFAHTDYNFFGPKIGFDIFRFEDGKIVEHWDNLQETAGPNPSGHTMTDGPSDVSDTAKTEKNKALVRTFIEDVLVGGNMGSLANYFDGDRFIQHNPGMADGLSGLGSGLEAMAKQGIVMKYDKVHMVLGEGNYVLAASEGSFAGKHTSFYDLFRVEDGKLAEHWDVLETIPPRSEHKNDNGKF